MSHSVLLVGLEYVLGNMSDVSGLGPVIRTLDPTSAQNLSRLMMTRNSRNECFWTSCGIRREGEQMSALGHHATSVARGSSGLSVLKESLQALNHSLFPGGGGDLRGFGAAEHEPRIVHQGPWMTQN